MTARRRTDRRYGGDDRAGAEYRTTARLAEPPVDAAGSSHCAELLKVIVWATVASAVDGRDADAAIPP